MYILHFQEFTNKYYKFIFKTYKLLFIKLQKNSIFKKKN